MMQANASARPREFWDTIAEHVIARVQPTLQLEECDREPVIAYLRDLEAAARRECESRNAIPIIASGRHVLGDRQDVGPVSGPFSRVSGRTPSLIAVVISGPHASGRGDQNGLG